MLLRVQFRFFMQFALFAGVLGAAAAQNAPPARTPAPSQMSPAQALPPPQTTLRLYVGGVARAEAMRALVDIYANAHPQIKIEIEAGGATPELQQSFLNSALQGKEAVLDLVLVDVIRLAQWSASNWAEPLDLHLGAEKDAVMARYLPASRAASIINGKIMALPVSADAQMLYYRKDLLEKYGIRTPTTWDDVKLAVQTITAGENRPDLRGLELTGAPIESTVCTFLAPLWGMGEDLLQDGKLNLASEASKKPFSLLADFKAAVITPPNLADLPTDRVRQNFQAGNVIFAVGWGYAWPRMQNDADTAVKDKVAIAPLPGFTPERQVSCLGGWQVAVSAASKHKSEAVKLARWLSSPEAQKRQAFGGVLPVHSALYADLELLAAHPWFAQVYPVLLKARVRPQSPRYGEISEAIRINLSAFLAGTKTADAAHADIMARLVVIFR